MNTGKLKSFARNARRQLLEQVESKLAQVLADGSLARRESAKAVKELETQIGASSRQQVIERVAYTWFNRFCALRFMDVNRFTRIGTVSPSEGFQQPEILMEAKQGHIDDDWNVDKQRVLGLLDGTLPSADPQQEAYRVLLVAVCNSYHALMPFMFERIADYTELLIPDDLLSDNSVLTQVRTTLSPESCQDVDVIGWLYQFYIAEKKDQVFEDLKKGKKITPENIPAATQLFTPHWIVRYLVENSLGRLWMLNHPDSRLIGQMDYYIRQEESETDFLRINSPEEIKVCDPACGSGHMLTYAFDLLYAIYEEQGYQATDIPQLILTHNLYGIEIDQRAGALAAFALTMKARQKYRRFLQSGKAVLPNICVLENIQIDPEDLSAYMDKVGRNLFTGGLQRVVNQWEEADNFGSLIRPQVTDVSEVRELLRAAAVGEDLFLAGVHQKVLGALRQADYLSPKYHVVVANPPYMGNRNMFPELRDFLGKHYSDFKSDLFSSCIARFSELAIPKGCIAMMSPNVWMFISSHEDLRHYLLSELSLQSLVELPLTGFAAATVQICAFILDKRVTCRAHTAVFVRLVDFKGGEAVMADKSKVALSDAKCAWRFVCDPQQFNAVPGRPIAYWISSKARELFSKCESLSEIGEARLGMATGNNEIYVRCWSEVSFGRIGLSCSSRDEAMKTRRKWFPYNKGGAFRKWYGNAELIVDWENDGERLQRTLHPSGTRIWAHNFNLDYIFRECLTYTSTSSSYFGIRYSGPGFLFDNKGSSFFSDRDTLLPALGFLASNVATYLLGAINPTVEFQPGNIAVLPFRKELVSDVVAKQVRGIIDKAKSDWDRQETSWEFQSSPLESRKGDFLAKSYSQLREVWNRETVETHASENVLNATVAAAYNLENEIPTAVPLEAITLSCNPCYRYGGNKSESELEALLLADTMREFISYAVGCMLGRYSPDKPGLILANQGETADEYREQIPEPRFPPDEDNSIPLLDGDWFEDDIRERFKAFLKVTFGTEHYEENLTFLENALYPDNRTAKKRKTLRDYFLKEFYDHHIKLYKKRPIYWLFSSPRGTFNALIYMHRYRPDTVSVVLGYLRDFILKLTASVDHLQSVADGTDASKSEKARALKEIATLKKDMKELNDYEHKVLFPLAQRQIEIDLDDGVKVNYNKFGKALRKVTGLTE